MTFANEIKISTSVSKLSSRDEHLNQLSVGNFNNDDIPDFLITKISGLGEVPSTPIIMLGKGDGTWTESTLSIFADGVPHLYYAPRVAVADFNNDRISDLYFPDFGLDKEPWTAAFDVYMLSNNSTKLENRPIFETPQKSKPHGYSVGDINSDGYVDLVINNLYSSIEGVLSHSDLIFINDGKGGLIEKSEMILPQSLRYTNPNFYSHQWSALIDINGDSHLDLVLGTWEASGGKRDPALLYSSFVLNDGSGNFSNSQVYSLPKTPIYRENIVDIDGIDLNRDGYKDLIISSTNGGSPSEFYRKGYIQILINNKDNTFTDETQTRFAQDANAEGPWWKFVKPVDFNKDGAMDLLLVGAGGVVYEQNRAASVLINDGKGNFTKVFDLPSTIASPDAIEVLDVNSDGKPDLVYTRQDSVETSSLYAMINDFATEVPNGVYDIYRFFNIKTGAHFYTGSTTEKDNVLKIDGYIYEGNVFDSNALQISQESTPVYRLYNTINAVHFYTASTDERDAAVATGNFNDEGVAYYAFREDGAGREALYRFFNPTTGTHFYTANESEKIENQANNPGLNYEGVAYYVGGPAPSSYASAIGAIGIHDIPIAEIG